MFVGGGGVNLYFYHLETATNVFSMEDMVTFGRDVSTKGAFPKISFISDLSFELWHLYKSLLPSVKGLSI